MFYYDYRKKKQVFGPPNAKRIMQARSKPSAQVLANLVITLQVPTQL